MYPQEAIEAITENSLFYKVIMLKASHNYIIFAVRIDLVVALTRWNTKSAADFVVVPVYLGMSCMRSHRRERCDIIAVAMLFYPHWITYVQYCLHETTWNAV